MFFPHADGLADQFEGFVGGTIFALSLCQPGVAPEFGLDLRHGPDDHLVMCQRQLFGIVGIDVELFEASPKLHLAGHLLFLEFPDPLLDLGLVGESGGVGRGWRVASQFVALGL